jgi:hypothetical protein
MGQTFVTDGIEIRPTRRAFGVQQLRTASWSVLGLRSYQSGKPIWSSPLLMPVSTRSRNISTLVHDFGTLTLPRFRVHQTHAAFRLRSKSAGDR